MGVVFRRIRGRIVPIKTDGEPKKKELVYGTKESRPVGVGERTAKGSAKGALAGFAFGAGVGAHYAYGGMVRQGASLASRAGHLGKHAAIGAGVFGALLGVGGGLYGAAFGNRSQTKTQVKVLRRKNG